jgi:hypothetical protein
MTLEANEGAAIGGWAGECGTYLRQWGTPERVWASAAEPVAHHPLYCLPGCADQLQPEGVPHWHTHCCAAFHRCHCQPTHLLQAQGYTHEGMLLPYLPYQGCTRRGMPRGEADRVAMI